VVSWSDHEPNGSSFDRLRTSECTDRQAHGGRASPRGELVEPRAKRLVLRQAQDERVY